MNNPSISFMLSRVWFWTALLDGLKITLYVSAVSILLAFIFGIIVGVARYSEVPVISQIATAYIELLRNIPLVLLMLFCFLVFQLRDVTAAIVALTLFTTAVIAEVVRGGLNSVSKGQWEAARSQGFSYVQILRYIVLPPAVTKMIPPIVSQFVTAIKDSSFALILGVVELVFSGNILKGLFPAVGQILAIYAVIAGMYFVINFTLSLVARYLQKRMSAGGGTI